MLLTSTPFNQLHTYLSRSVRCYILVVKTSYNTRMILRINRTVKHTD